MLAKGQWNYKGIRNHIYGIDSLTKPKSIWSANPKGFIKALVRCSDY